MELSTGCPAVLANATKCVKKLPGSKAQSLGHAVCVNSCLVHAAALLALGQEPQLATRTASTWPPRLAQVAGA